MSKVTVRSQRPIHHSFHFDIVQYKVERDGQVHTHDNVIMGDDVFILPLTPDNEVYLVSQYRYLLGKENLEMIAGLINAGEEPEEAARRELKEEAGLSAGKMIKIATFFSRGEFYQWKVACLCRPRPAGR